MLYNPLCASADHTPPLYLAMRFRFVTAPSLVCVKCPPTYRSVPLTARDCTELLNPLFASADHTTALGAAGAEVSGNKIGPRAESSVTFQPRKSSEPLMPACVFNVPSAFTSDAAGMSGAANADGTALGATSVIVLNNNPRIMRRTTRQVIR